MLELLIVFLLTFYKPFFNDDDDDDDDDDNNNIIIIIIGEVLRRLIGKCVMNIVKKEFCAGLKPGTEAAIHAMHTIFEADETDGVLLIDASNAFSALKRQAALHNIRVQCPIIATYAINTYRLSARLFITGGQEMREQHRETHSQWERMPLASSLSLLVYKGACKINQWSWPCR